MFKKRCLQVITILLVLSAIVFTPYVVEKLIIKISGDPFNAKIMLPREAWFGFIASYIGAIGTIALGFIAVWQNKRYKELSDTSSREVVQIQKELKDLNKRIVNAIETLKNIEVAIYTPVIQPILSTFYRISKETLDEENEVCTYQVNCINTDPADLFLPIDKLMIKHSTFGFSVCNIGEKTIRDFTCCGIKIDNEIPGATYNSPTDMMSGETTYILFANLPLMTGDNYLELNFEFATLLLDRYIFNVEALITYYEDSFDCNFINFEEPHKVL